MITVNDNIERQNTEHISMYHALWYAILTVIDLYAYISGYERIIFTEILSALLGPESITIFPPTEPK